MKAIKFAVVILALSGITAMAQDKITWKVAGETMYETTDSYIEFFVNVDVTGANQGLATFLYDISITKLAGPAGGAAVGGYINDWPSLSWGAYYANTKGYKSPATTLRGTVIDSAQVGGAGISVLPSLGYNDTPGFIADVGSGVLNWDPIRLDGKSWTGSMQWGVGMESRKANLLVDPAGEYMVNLGYWSVASFVAANGEGIYKVEVLPRPSAVLRGDLDLSQPIAGGVTKQADELASEALIFQVGVPEPTTLLLLAGAGAFIRRRRHA